MSDVDLDKYRRHVAHLDLSEQRKTEVLRAVWQIMQNFVDRAFGDDPAQQCRVVPLRTLEGKSQKEDATRVTDRVDSSEDPHPDNKEDLTRAFRSQGTTARGEKDSS